MSIYFDKINPENFRTFTALKVKPNQEDFVASNPSILARAFAYREYNSEVYGIYFDDTPVGLLMFHDYHKNEKLYCLLSEFMIADKYQGKGYGRKALEIWISIIKNSNKYDSIMLCYIEGDDAAYNLYKGAEFYLTGEIDEDEIIMEYNF